MMGFVTRLCIGALGLASTARTSQYCDPVTSVCYEETKAGDLYVRMALPAVEQAPFDVLVQIVAPTATAGWAAVAWGGKMTKNPITLAWPNGDSTIVSSRWTDNHVLPEPYAGATYRVLRGSTVNATHWTLTTLCSGCSNWPASSDETTLNPKNESAKFAYALSPTPPAQPADNTSSITKHTVHDSFTLTLAAARTDRFEEYIRNLS
ncbi:iron reductase domain protein [Astrocystis sublimbata]|nr:iron reductase domain protein [Astrocystis sublimbata]